MSKVRYCLIDGAQQYGTDILELLAESDNEFVPPLSSRSSTTQKNLNETTQYADTSRYFEKMKTQQFILAIYKNKVAGFLSYIPGIIIEELCEWGEIEYVSTIIVRKNMRKKRIATNLYRVLIERSSSRKIVTRTWSTNTGHINLLGKLAFNEILRIENGRGEGIDTVYFGREII